MRELLLAGRRKVREVLVAGDRRDAEALEDIAALATELGVAVSEVSAAKLERIARTEAPQGVVALAEPLPESDVDDLLRAGRVAPFLLLLDGVTDPGNVGALLRTAECAGVTGVILPRHRAAHITPAAAKAAAGAVEHLPIALVGGLPSTIASLRDRGVWVIGLDMGGATDLASLPAFDGPVALVLGAEGRGLSRLVRERVDVVASIPMQGKLGSLNVAAAGAIACYELARRRTGEVPPR